MGYKSNIKSKLKGLNYVEFGDVVIVSVLCESCLTLCDPMDCSLPGSSARRNFQARILESVAISYSTINYTPIR